MLHPPHPHPSTVSWIHSRNFFEKDTVLACLHTANQPAGQLTAAWHSLAPQMFQMSHPNRLAKKSSAFSFLCVGDSTKVVFFRLGFRKKTQWIFVSCEAAFLGGRDDQIWHHFPLSQGFWLLGWSSELPRYYIHVSWLRTSVGYIHDFKKFEHLY